MIVSDIGAERTCNALPAWCEDIDVERYCMTSSKPMQNGYLESSNHCMRGEQLNDTLFLSMDQ